MTTPDPITAAREALPYVYHPGVSPKLWAESLAKVNAAFDCAEKLQSALSVTQEEGRTEIARLEDDVEKLKAERDALEKSVSAHWKEIEHLNAATDSEITRLTSQLEQAEMVIKPFADENEAQTEERPSSVKDSARPYMFYRATYADLSALSQWIKDRQAKADAIGDK